MKMNEIHSCVIDVIKNIIAIPESIEDPYIAMYGLLENAQLNLPGNKTTGLAFVVSLAYRIATQQDSDPALFKQLQTQLGHLLTQQWRTDYTIVTEGIKRGHIVLDVVDIAKLNQE